MDNTFLLAQICGFIALLFSVARLQFKNPRHITLGEVPTATMWSVQYYLLGAQAGLIINLLCIIRGALVYFIPEKFLKRVIAGFLLIVTFFILRNATTPFDLFALAGVYIYAIACLFRDNRPLMARLILLHSIPWLVYNIIFASYFGTLSSTLGMASGIIGMMRHEQWQLGKCYRTFIASLIASIFILPRLKEVPNG